MDNLNQQVFSNFKASTTCYRYFIEISDGEIVSGGDYYYREECNHNMRKDQSNWDTVKIALMGFLCYGTDEDTYKFVEICQALDKNSRGYSIVKEIATEKQSTIKEEVRKKEVELKKIQALLDTLNKLLV